MAKIDIPAGFPLNAAPLPPGVTLPSRPAHGAVHAAPRPELRSGEVRGRNGEILTRNNRSNDVADQFDLPLHMQEKGWSYQWVRATCYGKPDPQNVHVHEENGWRAVPSNRWPGHFHPPEFKGAVTREGLILMERPAVLTQQAIDDGIRAAKSQRRAQSASFQGVEKLLHETHADAAGFEAASDQTDSRGKARPMLRRTVEQAPLSSYPERTLAVGDEI